MSFFEEHVELHRLYQEARSQHNSYFERLAILDGGTVALVITAVLGPLHGEIRHWLLLGLGLTFLVLAMLGLLLRNYLAVQIEFHAVAYTVNSRETPTDTQTKTLQIRMRYIESTGLFLSAIGILLLLTEVWLMLAGSGYSPSAEGHSLLRF
jgi:hypothetical protein